MKNILIFRTDRLGDFIIHSRPIYELKKKFKDSKIIIVCSKLNSKILDRVDYIDEKIIYDQNFPIFKKISILIKLIKIKYYAIFILDGKKFSLFCNIFLKSSYKFGFAYKYQKSIFNKLLIYFKPNKLYRNIFFDKISYFTSRKYLKKTDSLCQKYLDLFNFFNLKLTINDNYIFQTNDKSQNKFNKLREDYNIDEYLLIHFDEKWLDITSKYDDLALNIIKLQEKFKKKIILTGYKNNFEYYNYLKNSFTSIDMSNEKTSLKNNSNILILDNLDIYTFERLIKNSILNISCHSGFIVQVCGANNGKILDIIHEKDLKWYKCWVPAMIFHKITLKSTFKNGLRNLESIFDDILQIAKKL